MKYEETIWVDNREMVEELLGVNPEKEEDMFHDTMTFTAHFPDGKEVDVKICGNLEFEDGGWNLPWCEAVLFNENGCEICFTEPADDIFGEWELEADGNEYIVNVA